MREQEPADDATNDVASRQGNVDIECLKLRKARIFQEDDRVSKDRIATEDLSGPDDAVLSGKFKISLRAQPRGGLY